MSSAYSVAGCASTDLACACGTGAATIYNIAQPCLESNCNGTTRFGAYAATLAACSMYRVTGSIPPTIYSIISNTFDPSFSTRFATSNSSSPSSPSPTPAPSLSSTGSAAPQQTSSSSTNPPNSESQTASASASAGGLSTGAKAGIGVGVTLGVLLFVGFGALTFWYGRRSATRKRKEDGTWRDKPELGPGVPTRKELDDTSVPLSEEEREELRWRRRAAELEGSPGILAELPTERAQLKALRERSNVPVEMG